MPLETATTLGAAATRFYRRDLDGRVRFPTDRLGHVLETADGTYTLYRETALASPGRAPAATVVRFGLDVPSARLAGALEGVLTDPVSTIATPFFAGLPGFRRKLWLAGEDGSFLELYEFATPADAERFVDMMEALLAPLSVAGTATFEVHPETTVESWVAARSRAWRDASARDRPALARARHRVLAVLVLGGALMVAAAVLRGRRGSPS